MKKIELNGEQEQFMIDLLTKEIWEMEPPISYSRAVNDIYKQITGRNHDRFDANYDRTD